MTVLSSQRFSENQASCAKHIQTVGQCTGYLFFVSYWSQGSISREIMLQWKRITLRKERYDFTMAKDPIAKMAQLWQQPTLDKPQWAPFLAEWSGLYFCSVPLRSSLGCAI